jgi:hypothetical protein
MEETVTARLLKACLRSAYFDPCVADASSVRRTNPLDEHRKPHSLSVIAAMPDSSNWVALLRERISDIGFDEGEEALSEVARAIFHAEAVVRNTLSGGLGNLVPPCNSLDEARAIQVAMVRVGAPRMAEVFRLACDLVASTPDTALHDEESEASLALQALEEEFWAIGFDEPNGAVQEFIWRHRDDFRAS